MQNRGVLNCTGWGFDRLIRKGLKLNLCTRCGKSPDVIVHFPIYGKWCAKVVCACGNRSNDQKINLTLSTRGRFGTPATERSIGRGVGDAMRDWNEANPFYAGSAAACKNKACPGGS